MNKVGDLAVGTWRIRNIWQSEAIGIITLKPMSFPYNSSLGYLGYFLGSTRMGLGSSSHQLSWQFQPRARSRNPQRDEVVWGKF